MWAVPPLNSWRTHCALYCNILNKMISWERASCLKVIVLFIMLSAKLIKLIWWLVKKPAWLLLWRWMDRLFDTVNLFFHCCGGLGNSRWHEEIRARQGYIPLPKVTQLIRERFGISPLVSSLWSLGCLRIPAASNCPQGSCKNQLAHIGQTMQDPDSMGSPYPLSHRGHWDKRGQVTSNKSTGGPCCREANSTPSLRRL